MHNATTMELIATLHNVTCFCQTKAWLHVRSASDLGDNCSSPSGRFLWGPGFPDRIFTIDYGDWQLETDSTVISHFKKGNEHLIWHWDSNSGVRLSHMPQRPLRWIHYAGGAVVISVEPNTLHIAPLLIDPFAPPAPPPGILPNDAPIVPLRQALEGASDVHPPLVATCMELISEIFYLPMENE